MKFHIRSFAILLFVILSVANGSLHAQPTSPIYFSQSDGIYRADLKMGTKEPILLSGFLDIIGDLVIDSVSQNLYWTNGTFLGPTGLYRADDSGQVSLLEADIDLGGLALDPVRRELFWTKDKSLWSTNLNDGLSESLYQFPTEYTRISDMEIDPQNRILYLVKETDFPSQELWHLFLDEMRLDSVGTFLGLDIELEPGDDSMLWVSGDWPYKLYRSTLDLADTEEVYPFSLPGEPIYNPAISLDESKNVLFFSNIDGVAIGSLDLESKEVTLFDVPYVRQAQFAHDGNKVYWTEPLFLGVAEGIIYQANYDGTQVDTFLVSYGDYASDLYVSPEGNEVYWMEDVLFDNETLKEEAAIRKATIEGGVPEVVTLNSVNGSDFNNAMAIDFDNGYMYWSDTSWVHRADLEGQDIEPLFELDQSLRQIELDLHNGKMYWTEGNVLHVHRANLDGSGAEELFFLTDRSQFVVDTQSSRIRWIDSSGNLNSEDLGGGNRETLDTALILGSTLLGIDLAENMLYYRQGFDSNNPDELNRFRRIHIDGTGDELVFLEGHLIPLSLMIPGKVTGTSAHRQTETPTVSRLDHYPNPFNSILNLDLQVDKGQFIKVNVVDMLGRHITTLFDGRMAQGSHSITWAPRASLTNGVYFVHINSETGLLDTRKVIKCC